MVDDEVKRTGTPVTEAFAETEPGAHTATRSSTTDLEMPATLPAAGYELGDVIGRGGMGEVLAAHDLRIGREVAFKRMRSASPSTEASNRFMREARIQARLDHPAIVPVHEIGTDGADRPYFTMKRLTGRTLQHRLADGGALNRILRAYVEVCLAVEYAHARGVIHRDLKPSNIMLGDYGEVYVLDWGVARVASDPRPDATDPLEQGDIQTLDDTKTGAMLGTPGYMAPEQLRGITPTAAADVYSLGAILFEILAHQPLHPRGEAAIGSTLARPQASPLERKGDRVPPELDELCVAALAEEPTERPTAHQLAEAVASYLDGDRDYERRRQLAAQQLASARDALASTADDARATAMRRAGRALALDPESPDAGALVSSLLLEPPAQMPPPLAASLEEYERKIAQHRSRKSALAYLAIVAVAPALLFLDVKNWTMVGMFYGTVALAILVAVDAARAGRPSVASILVVNLALALMFTRILGPFMITPLAICAMLVGLTAIRRINQHLGLVIAWTVAAVMLPIILEWLDVLPRTWEVTNGATLTMSNLFVGHGDARVEMIALVCTNLLFTVVVGLVAYSFNRKRQDSQRQLFVQAWHLRQLIPAEHVATLIDDGAGSPVR